MDKVDFFIQSNYLHHWSRVLIYLCMILSSPHANSGHSCSNIRNRILETFAAVGNTPRVLFERLNSKRGMLINRCDFPYPLLPYTHSVVRLRRLRTCLSVFRSSANFSQPIKNQLSSLSPGVNLESHWYRKTDKWKW
jgi:hypothetical protein